MSGGVMLVLKVEDIANSIRKLKKADKEMLLLLLLGESLQIAKRVREIKTKKVKPLTRQETFKGVLMSKRITRRDLTGKEILDTLREHRDILKKYKVKKIGLFGSYTKGEQKRKSDIDLLVEFDMTAFDENFRGLFDNFMDLSSYLEKLFGKKVDILTPVSVDSIRIKEVSEEIKRSVVYA